MEEIILKLLATDNELIQQGTAQLREAFKNPESTPALYHLMISSGNAEVRQYSAILLKKNYAKGKNWSSLKDNVKAEFKAVLMQAVMQEAQKSVRNSITQLIGIIVKHELPHNGFPEVLQFIKQRLESRDLNDQEFGMYILCTITEVSPDTYLPHLHTIIELLNATLNSLTDLANPVASYVLDTMLNFVPLIEGNQLMVNAYHQMMPQVIQVIQSLSTVHPEKAMKGFELLEGLCECAASVVASRLKPLVEMCLFIINNPSFDEDLKISAAIFIGVLVKIKKKAIVKHKLVEPIIDMLFVQMCSKPENEEEEVYFTGDQDKRLITAATQTLDLLALHLPPEKLVLHLLSHIEPALKDTNVYAKKASYLSMAILAEGCSEFIRSKYLQPFLQCICQGITETSAVVRNAALFALGQFSEYLQPDISRYADEVLPILFNFLNQVSLEIEQGKKDLPAADRIFYALEIFAENLNEELLPYLPILMPTLFKILENSNSSINVRELALSAIGAAANASKEFMLPYFENIINILHHYLVNPNPTTENVSLQAQAVDTLGALARNIGKENFAPLAMKSLEMSMNILQSTDDPDLKKSVYGLLASISTIMKENMSGALPNIISHLITSIQSTEGIVDCLKDDEDSKYVVIDDHSDHENDEEDIENTDNEDDDNDNDMTVFNVENAYIEEKEEAILALKEIAEHTGLVFAPFLKKSFEEVYKFINYPQEDIRKASIEALTQFTINFSNISKEDTQEALSQLIPKLSELIRLDEERGVVMQALDACTELLEHLKSEVLVYAGHKEAMINCVTEVLMEGTECQDQDDEDGDEGEAEYDELLYECAGQLLVGLGKATTPDDFVQIFKIMFPIFVKRLTKSKSDSQKSFIIGTMLECLPELQHHTKLFVPDLYQILLNYTNDPFDETRSNAIFGIGELAFYGEETVYSHYVQILQILSNAISKETNANARDNIIGAIARLIITNHSLIPLDQVFPVFVSHLPLKEDLTENVTVFKCIIVLYKNGHTVLKQHMNSILKAAIELLQDKKTDAVTKEVIVEFMKPVQRDFPEEWNSLCSNFTEQNLTELQQLLM